jgi:hypothetical protein
MVTRSQPAVTGLGGRYDAMMWWYSGKAVVASRVESVTRPTRIFGVLDIKEIR